MAVTLLMINKRDQFWDIDTLKRKMTIQCDLKIYNSIFPFVKTRFPSLTTIFSGQMISTCFLHSLSSGDALKFQNVLILTLLCCVSALHINLKLPLSLVAHMKGFSVASSTKEIYCAPAQHL